MSRAKNFFSRAVDWSALVYSNRFVAAPNNEQIQLITLHVSCGFEKAQFAYQFYNRNVDANQQSVRQNTKIHSRCPAWLSFCAHRGDF